MCEIGSQANNTEESGRKNSSEKQEMPEMAGNPKLQNGRLWNMKFSEFMVEYLTYFSPLEYFS